MGIRFEFDAEFIETWQYEYGEDFIVDGPIDYDMAKLINPVIVEKIKNSPLFSKYSNNDEFASQDDYEEMYNFLCDEVDVPVYEDDDALYEIQKIFAEAFNETEAGEMYIKEIIENMQNGDGPEYELMDYFDKRGLKENYPQYFL